MVALSLVSPYVYHGQGTHTVQKFVSYGVTRFALHDMDTCCFLQATSIPSL